MIHQDTSSKGALESSLRQTPVGRTRLYEQVAARIEELIVNGKLRPGDQLPSERDLMDLFSVGRPAVREALFELQRKGIVNTRAGTRSIVVSPTTEVILSARSGSVRLYLATVEGMKDFQNARRVLEIAVAREAAIHARPEDIDNLEVALEENVRARDQADLFIRTDVAFHLAMAQMMGSGLMLTLYRGMDVWLSEQRAVSISPAGSRAAAIAAHRAIFEAIRKHDPDAVEAAMARHLEEIQTYYWQVRENQSG